MPKRTNPRCPLGKELARTRVDLDETLNDMGRRLGIHPSTLRMYESGARLPDQDFFRQVKTVYSVDLSRFYVEPTKSATSVYGRFLALPVAELEALSAIFKRNSVPTPKIILRAIAEKNGVAVPTAGPGRPKAAIGAKSLPKVALAKPAPVKDVDDIKMVDDEDDLDEIIEGLDE